jgi:type VI secretion system protein ImpG
MALQTYYQDELTYLRELGAEFARANPKLAPFLGREAADPDVERLLEGFSFLVARLRQRLDDELPELSHSLIRLLWPHYLRPIPPLTIMAFDAAPAATQGIVRIPGGAQVRSRPIDGVSCVFATCYDVDVFPFAIAGVEIDNRPSSARMVFRLKPVGKATLGALRGGTIRIFLNFDRDAQLGRILLLWLLRYVQEINCSTESGARIRLGPGQLRAAGYSEAERVLPWPSNTFAGFQSLQEYLTFPAKFMFVELTGLEAIASEGGRTLTAAIEFNRAFPDQLRVSDANLRLNCVPAINLFANDADPIRIDQTKSEYRVRPTGGGNYSLHSILEVSGFKQGRSERQVYPPFESFRHDLPGDPAGGVFYRERLRPAIVGKGADTYISFCTRLDALTDPGAEVVSLRLNCTNGPIAERTPIGGIDQPTADIPSQVTFNNIATVTPEIPAPIGDNLLWRLVANLARNYGSYFDIGALRDALALYDFRSAANVQSRRRLELLLEGLLSFETEDGDTVVRGVPMRLRRVTLIASESKLGGEGELFMLGSILDAFFASYASVNDLHKFAIRAVETRVEYEWPMRSPIGRRY